MKVSTKDIDLVWQSIRRVLLLIDNVDMEGIDNYWVVLPSDSVQLDSCPEPAVGSFIEDWNNLKRLVDNPDDALLPDLDAFASVISLVSEKLVPSDHGEK